MFLLILFRFRFTLHSMFVSLTVADHDEACVTAPNSLLALKSQGTSWGWVIEGGGEVAGGCSTRDGAGSLRAPRLVQGHLQITVFKARLKTGSHNHLEDKFVVYGAWHSWWG